MQVEVDHLENVKFVVRARKHIILSDQPVENGGTDEGMTPPELLLGALASCAAYYAAQHLKGRNLASSGTHVVVTAAKLKNPARRDNFSIEVTCPIALTPDQLTGIERSVHQCLTHNTLRNPPTINTAIKTTALERRWSCAILAAFSFSLVGCAFDGGGGPPPFSIQPIVRGVAVGSKITFTAAGSVDTSHAVWNINGTSSSDLGSFAPAEGSSTVYTAPATPPLYPTSPDPLIQGTVTLRANLVGDTADAVTFHVTAPTVKAAITPASATVPLGGSQQFSGYAVGAVNNAVIWQVNGVIGGNAQFGTVSPIGVYIAPSSLPQAIANGIALTLISAADPTVTAVAAIVLK